MERLLALANTDNTTRIQSHNRPHHHQDNPAAQQAALKKTIAL
jgi:hypothetical protein